ncbi:hypothetical protein FOA43_000692 [Brettanomyces nanus]|uniref:UDP-glucose:glycoprotein glucosyltransferase n=1 Tax=Eeniella nana TaxID=13502 RepID=A0A875RZR9_EENNA|nr:uncharacterized protein FOA43_000692 [Brettanomyces nanus]QPG73382.1 hypothetical protein FOA43_000692 [Brettanomyces nanus]
MRYKKRLDLSLVGSWKTTPFKLNVLESVCQYDHSLYRPLVEKLLQLEVIEESEDDDEGVVYDVDFDNGSMPLSDQQYYKYAMSLIDSPITENLVNINLANRIDSPKIEANYQYFRNFIKPKNYCPGESAFIVQGEDVYCHPTDVFALKTVDNTGNGLQLLPTDHLLGRSDNKFALYGDFRSGEFRKMFSFLYQSMLSGRLSFVWRYIPDETVQNYELLGGYGIDMTLKRTDYVVIDDRGFTEEQQQKMKFDGSVVNENISNDEQLQSENVLQVPNLKDEDIKLLGVKLTKLVLDHPLDEQLDVLTDMVQDFPKFAASVAGLNYNESDLKILALKSLQDSQINIPSGLFINNAVVSDLKADMFEVMKVFERELKYSRLLDEIGFNASTANGILSTFASYQHNFAKMPYRRYDLSDYSKNVIYFNDIEKDAQYSDLQPAPEAYSKEPGMGEIPSARENIYDTLFVFDLTDPVKLYYCLSIINQVLKNKVPERVGIIPLYTSKLGALAADQLLSINLVEGSNSALRYLHKLNHYMEHEELSQDTFSKFNVPEIDDDLIQRLRMSIDSMIDNFQLGNKPTLIVDGVIFPFNENIQLAVRQLGFDVYFLFNSFEKGKIPSKMSFKQYLYLDSLKTRLPQLIPDDVHSTDMSFIPTPSLRDMIDFDNSTDIFMSIIKHKCTKKPCYKTSNLKTITLIGSFKSENFRHQLVEALRYVQSTYNIKLKVIDIENTQEFNRVKALSKDIGSAIREVKNANVEPSEDATERPGFEAVKKLGIHNLDNTSIIMILNGRAIDLSSHRVVSAQEINVVCHFESRFRLNLLWKILRKQKAAQAIGKTMFHDNFDWFEYSSWLISDTHFRNSQEFVYEGLPRYNTNVLDDSLAIHIPARSDTLMYISLVIDPISESAQKYLSMLSLFKRMNYADIKIHLLPSVNMKSLNVKRLYRGMFLNKASFDERGNVNVADLKISFDNVPQRNLFTVNVDDPQSWIVTIKEADSDLDNLKLDLTGPVKATYELKNILIEGYARDLTTTGMRPLGLPVELLDEQKKVYSDTNIMANFGYMQLKANPGRWALRIKPESKGSSIYSLIEVEEEVPELMSEKTGLLYEKGVSSYPLYILDLKGLIVFPLFNKKPGKEEEFLVKVGQENKEQPKSLLSRFQEKMKLPALKRDSAEINIFTVASGHLYERFLGIMTASVMAHTKHTVKFWLIENYMSPQLKVDLPILAEHYGFNYELVTFKWPAWLMHQREKQRVIWGYKILFLDVLFPQELDKVIFVDADQIVRTDLKELMDLDLEGAPYGFTPMCDSRKEMEGFRFWKKGYWKELLGDKYKYHISALYVVDLTKFRSIAAGDILRHHYQHLSSDPESLSNLDQDLPNNLQDVLKIHSLPQNWLWCETWCSDESLKDARTIDLCNNPLTKEPKLDRARRQIPEWTSYDDEIAALVDRTRGDPVQGKNTAGKNGLNHDEL